MGACVGTFDKKSTPEKNTIINPNPFLAKKIERLFTIKEENQELILRHSPMSTDIHLKQLLDANTKTTQ